MTADELVKAYKLLPHPEGGYYRETYRSSEQVPSSGLPSSYGGPRAYSTAIYFLVPEGAKSRLHRVRSDELWHFYLGGPFELVEILPSGEVTRTRLGQDLDSGCVVQHVVRAGSWFGGAPEAGAAYSFVGCTVAPGFDFSDFELGRRDDLLRLFPGAEREILALTD